MCPDEEMEDDEKAEGDEDIAEARTTLQPAHQSPGFVPNGPDQGLSKDFLIVLGEGSAECLRT
jgi:hypothetical protein